MNEEPQIESPMRKDEWIDPTMFVMRLPECCKEARDDCPHVVQKPEKIKRNVGL